MNTTPLVMVTDAQVFYELRAESIPELSILIRNFKELRMMFNRNGEGLQSVCRSNDTSIPIGLFLIRIVLLNETMVVTSQFLIPLNRSEIGGLKEYCAHWKILSLRYPSR